MTLRVLDLFSGIGGFSLGLERTGGFQTVAFCEQAKFPRSILAKHWPEVPCYDDVRSVTAARLAADGLGGVAVLTGGFPCQDISAASAGRATGLAGARSGLWWEMHRIIAEVRPRWVIAENSPRLRGLGLDQVLGSLVALGYSCRWDCVPAEAVGAPHSRDRIWIVAHANGEGQHALPIHAEVAGASPPAADADRSRLAFWEGFGRHLQSQLAAFERSGGASVWRSPQPSLCRVDDGLSAGVVRAELAALGNSVVPVIPYMIGRAILAVEAALACQEAA